MSEKTYPILVQRDSNISTSISELKQEVTLYKYRWVQLTLYCMAAMLNQICWISLQPVAGVLQNAYGISNEIIAAISLIYMAIFIIFVFPTNYVLDRGGLKIGILLGIFLTVAGMWTKCLINKGFYFVLIG